MTIPSRLRPLPAWLVLLAAVSLRAETAPPEPGPAPADLKAVLAAAATLTQARLPDCDEATVESSSWRTIRADGTGEMVDETFVKVLTEKGRRNNTVQTASYQEPYDLATVSQLEVIRPDGQVVPVDIAANAKVSIDESQMQANIYDPNKKLLQVNVPRLEIGDLVHVVVRTKVERPFIPGEYAEDFALEGRGFIRHASIELHLAAGRPLRQIALRHEIPGTVSSATTEAGGQTVYRWEANNVPQMYDEPAMPPYEEVLQHLSVSTSPDWALVSRWYWELSQPHLAATTPAMLSEAAALAARATTDREKIQDIFYYVSKNIRYMGLTPEHDRPGLEPHDVRLTYEKKYGVCRDKAALLVSLLRAAGQKAYPVLVSVGRKEDPQVPSPSFNHAIAAVEVHPGDYLLMDPTDENTRDLLPSYLSDQSYLVCRPEGDVLRRTPVIPPEQNLMKIRTTGSLRADGALDGHADLAFEGVNDGIYRQAFNAMKPDDRQRFFEANLRDILPGLAVTNLRITPENLQDAATGLHVSLDFSVPSTTAFGSGQAVVTLPWLGKGMGLVNFILGGTGLEQRKYPMQTFTACGLQETITLRVADGFTGAVSLPAGTRQEDEGLSYERSFTFQNHELAAQRTEKLKTVEFSPAEYLRLKRVLKELQSDDRKAPVLAAPAPPAGFTTAQAAPPPPPVQPDTRIIEERHEVRIKDAHSAVYRVHLVKQVLTYNGKKKESEVKLEYNPAVDEARIVRAAVVAPSGQRQEISPGEINLMDAGWNGSAKRYTGGKVLVGNLPGVDLGSTIELDVELTEHDRAFLGTFVPFQGGDELGRKTYELSAPAGLPVQTLTRGPAGLVAAETKTVNGDPVWLWQANDVPALPDDYALPPGWAYTAGSLYFVGDPHQYYATLQQTLLDRSAQSARARALAKTLTASSRSPLEAMLAIRDEVARSIRLAGPAFTELPLRELSAADTTLADGYGHAADRAILLHALLQAAGLQPEFILVADHPAIPAFEEVLSRFPFPSDYQNVLVEVTIAGRDYYLNDTDQYAHPGSTAHDGALAIRLADQSTAQIRATQGDENGQSTAYQIELDDAGTARLQIRTEYSGQTYAEKKKFFAELPPEERRRYHQELVSQVAQGAQPTSDLVTAFDSYPGSVQYGVVIPDYGTVDGRHLYFELPRLPRLYPTITGQRTLPLYVDAATHGAIDIVLRLPPGFRQVLIAPRGQDQAAPAGAGSIHSQVTATADRWELHLDYERHPALVAPQDYPALQALETALESKASRLILLEQGPAAPAGKK